MARLLKVEDQTRKAIIAIRCIASHRPKNFAAADIIKISIALRQEVDEMEVKLRKRLPENDFTYNFSLDPAEEGESDAT